MWKSAMPVVLGLGLLAGGTVSAHAQTYPYYDPYYTGAPTPYYNPYYAGGAPAWQICPNTVFSNGYGSPGYYPNCGIESQSPGMVPDPYSWYRPYSSNVGPKPST
jgi:hypothetical protein